MRSAISDRDRNTPARTWRLAGASAVSILMLVVACSDKLTQPSDADQPAEPTTPTSSYVATLLPDGTFADHNSEAFLVIADNGDVFGSTSTEQAARWTIDANGSVTGPIFLGTLPAPFETALQFVTWTNTNGDVVVGAARRESSEPVVPWLWTNGSMMLLPLPEDVTVTRAVPIGVNDAGVVVGQIGFVTDGVSTDHGAVWLPPYDAAPILLPRLDAYRLHSAKGITNTGAITGWVRDFDGDELEALIQWQIDGQGNVISGPYILETADQLLLNATNQDLDAVGSYSRRQGYLFRSDFGQRIDLGVLEGQSSSSARGVTPRAPDGTVQIVGSSFTNVNDGRAVAWSVDGTNTVTGPVDIGLPEAHPNDEPANRFEAAGAFSINSQGWIVGWSRRGDGSVFSVVWQP